MPGLHCLDECSFVVSFEIGKYKPLNFFFFKIVLTVLGLLHRTSSTVMRVDIFVLLPILEGKHSFTIEAVGFS